MKTFQEWVKLHEKCSKKDMEEKEEELGQDLDGDDEEGEPEEHKKAVFGFCKKCKKATKKCSCK